MQLSRSALPRRQPMQAMRSRRARLWTCPAASQPLAKVLSNVGESIGATGGDDRLRLHGRSSLLRLAGCGMAFDLGAVPVLAVLCGRDRVAVEQKGARFGFAETRD